MLHAEGAIQAHLDKACFLAVRVKVIDDFLRRFADGAHGDDNMLGVGCAVIVKGLIVCPKLFVDRIHIALDDAGELVIEGVDRFPGLEVDVAALVRPAQDRVVRVVRTLAEFIQCVVINHLGEVIIIPDLDFLHFMRRPETVEEVQERHAALDGSQMCDGAQVHGLLWTVGGEHRHTRLAAGHNVALISEN